MPDGTELHRTSSTGVVTGTRYYVHNGSAVALRTPAGVTWLATDPHGTAMDAVTASSGAVVVRRTDPFGNPRDATAPAWPDTHAFLNKPVDPATGLVHVGARDYDPALGRFTSDDPLLDVADPQQLNGYAYADNSPTNNSDPDGRTCTNGFDGMCHTSHGDIPTPGLSDSQLGATRASDHDRAVADTGATVMRFVTSTPAMRKRYPHARVTVDLGGQHRYNRIDGGERNGSGSAGYADVILWTDRAVYIWEVKPAGDANLRFGRQQLDRYVKKLGEQLRGAGDHRQVALGFALPSRPPRGGRIESINGGSLRIWSERASKVNPGSNRVNPTGIRFYAVDDPPKRQQPQEQEQEQEAPAGAPVCRVITALGPCGPGMYPVYPGVPLPGPGKLPVPGLPKLPPVRIPLPIFVP